MRLYGTWSSLNLRLLKTIPPQLVMCSRTLPPVVAVGAFAFTDCDSAIAAIETPGWRQAATASALNSALCRRRRRRSMIVVFTCPVHFWWTRMLLSRRFRRQVYCPDGYGEVAGAPMIGAHRASYSVAFVVPMGKQTFLSRRAADSGMPAFFSSADFCRRRRQTARRLRRRTQETR